MHVNNQCSLFPWSKFGDTLLLAGSSATLCILIVSEEHFFLFGGTVYSLDLTHGVLQVETSATLCMLIVPEEHLLLFGGTVY